MLVRAFVRMEFFLLEIKMLGFSQNNFTTVTVVIWLATTIAIVTTPVTFILCRPSSYSSLMVPNSKLNIVVPAHSCGDSHAIQRQKLCQIYTKTEVCIGSDPEREQI